MSEHDENPGRGQHLPLTPPSEEPACAFGLLVREWIKAGQKRLDEQQGLIQGIIDGLRKELLGRPTWAVLATITFLSSACVGLLVVILK